MDRFLKRSFDVLFSSVLLVFLFPLIIIGIIMAGFDVGSWGLFRQIRVGMHGRLFNVYKIKTMMEVEGVCTTVSTSSDVRITKLGAIFRRTKIDELPQLWNVLVGDMSFVGPRPDVPGYADQLEGSDRVMLSIRPGITGPASIKYINEEELLAGQDNPQQYNDDVIWPDKVKLNSAYVLNYNFTNDMRYILLTIKGKNAET